MHQILNEVHTVYMHLCWFVSMSVGTLYPPLMPYDIMIPLICFALPFATHNNFGTRARKQRLALFPLFWVLIGIWGGLFRYRTGVTFPAYIHMLPMVTFWGYMLYSLILTLAHKHYRTITILLFLLNGWFAVTITFIASMSISGQWL